MERSRVTGYIRIAVTALSLTACVLLVALWVRSYWWRDNIYVFQRYRTNQFALLASEEGRCAFLLNETSGWIPPKAGLDSWPLKHLTPKFYPFDREPTWMGFDAFWFGPTSCGVLLPYWFVVSQLAIVAIVPWVRWTKRFSLRTLLIATTLVAVGLGAVIYLSG